ncbi:isoprenoid biosynthesis glyoxalase ElbB [Pseudomonas sp. F1_0610]|uniref:isoprenoid biosynthesis glyoxalase ElbB n=1 Tax=Pseudomonas sp. F1_0610 TaxID=3114284 RepID=UPI0039C2532A
MSKKVAVILSGCGYLDGAEINEAVLSLLYLDLAGAQVQSFAPNIKQLHVVDHLTGEATQEQRNVLTESARIVRGKIQDLSQLKVENFDALVVPGGFGVAKNLSDFALKGADCSVNLEVLAALKSFKNAGKPVGLICIAPALAAAVYGAGVSCTIGTDKATAEVLQSMGAQHKDCAVDAIVVDTQHKLVTTPAYMLAESISQSAKGIEALVHEVLRLA